MADRPPPPVHGDRAATRAKLLAAARRQLSAAGYGEVGVRDIAGEAGVNAALVNRYFGSKRALFTEVVGDQFAVSSLLVGDRATLGDRLARWLLKPRRPGFDPTLVLVRSAGHPEAQAVLRDSLAEQVTAPLAEWLGGADARERAGLVASVLFGVALARDVVGSDALDGDRDALAAHLGPTLQRLIDGA